MATKIQLPNGCSMSQPTIYPPEWKTGGKKLLELNWRLQYWFYDPRFKDAQRANGKLVVIKTMNELKDLKKRREACVQLIESEIHDNKNGYNPYHKEFSLPNTPLDEELHRNLPFIEAFRVAVSRLKCTKKHRKEITWAINRIERNALRLRMTYITIGQLRRVDMRRLLESSDLTDSYFNKYRSYLSSLFSELLEYECCEYNIIRDIRKRKIMRRDREVLTMKQLQLVMNHLKKVNYEFYRYSKIFMYSGGRSSELLRVKVKDVNLLNQEYSVTIMKGSHYKEVKKVILKNVVPLWFEQIKNAKPNDYVFSYGLIPGPKKLDPSQITRRWRTWVKNSDEIKDPDGNSVSITADFYANKHTMLDSFPAETARLIASHDSGRTTAIYRVNEQKRRLEKLKELDMSEFQRVI